MLTARSPQTREELKEFLLNLAQTFTAPVWFSRGIDEPPAGVKDSGSCGFVAHGEHRFIITAWHVIDGFRAAKMRTQSTIFAVNVGDGVTIALQDPEILAESRELDLATIAFPHLERERSRSSKRYFPVDRFPVQRAQAGDAITIVGFPGQGRQGFETFGKFEPYPITMTVSSVSDRRIILAEGDPQPHYERNGKSLPEGIEVGGFSGSPALGMNSYGELFLAGVVSDGTARLGCVGFPGYMALGSTEYLLPNGTFDQTRMPWL